MSSCDDIVFRYSRGPTDGRARANLPIAYTVNTYAYITYMIPGVHNVGDPIKKKVNNKKKSYQKTHVCVCDVCCDAHIDRKE